MFDFQNPILKGTEIFPRVIVGPPVVRVLGLENDQVNGQRIVDAYRGVIHHFHSAQRQNYSLSNSEYSKTFMDFRDGRIQYANIQGQEIITLTIRPEKIREILEEALKNEVSTPLIVGYVALLATYFDKANLLECTLNGNVLGIADFGTELTDYKTCYVWYFNKNALKLKKVPHKYYDIGTPDDVIDNFRASIGQSYDPQTSIQPPRNEESERGFRYPIFEEDNKFLERGEEDPENTWALAGPIRMYAEESDSSFVKNGINEFKAVVIPSDVDAGNSLFMFAEFFSLATPRSVSKAFDKSVTAENPSLLVSDKPLYAEKVVYLLNMNETLSFSLSVTDLDSYEEAVGTDLKAFP